MPGTIKGTKKYMFAIVSPSVCKKNLNCCYSVCECHELPAPNDPANSNKSLNTCTSQSVYKDEINFLKLYSK